MLVAILVLAGSAAAQEETALAAPADLYKEPEGVPLVSLPAGAPVETGRARGGYAGVYDTTPDGQPVLGAIPEHPGLFVDFGWSGHGFKHAPVIGDVMAELVLSGRSGDYDLHPFRWRRFQEGDLVPATSPAAPPPEEAAAGVQP